MSSSNSTNRNISANSNSNDSSNGHSAPLASAEDSLPLGPRNRGGKSGGRNGRSGGGSILSPLKSAVRRNSFVLLLLAAFMLLDTSVSLWDPMSTSRRFYKDDFTKTLYHHHWDRSGPVFFGNSAVTGAYMEDKAQSPLVELGLAYGKLTDLKLILQKHKYDVEDQLVIGIDAHTMLDQLQTDPTYPWFKRWYQPYLYFYRDYFKDSGKELVQNVWAGAKRGELDLHTYEPRWIDKELYFGPSKPESLKADWERYEKLFNWMTLDEMRDNLSALDWIIAYTHKQQLPLKVVIMPLNPDPAYPQPGYWKPLKEQLGQTLKAANVPVLDLSDSYTADKFHDLVHLNREVGAPQFTREVDVWLQSFANSSK